jgi:outer membrane protein assembly factor BamC
MAQLVRTAERAEITLAEGFDRAWRRVGVAIDRLGFTVEDRDRSKGVFFVRYRDPTVDTKEKQTGFFGRIFSGTGPTGESAAQYQVEVRSAGEKSTVRVLSEQGAVVNDANAKQMLDVLFEQLR